MRLLTENYLEQGRGWPATGRHILAQFDDGSIVVYQAFNHTIADEAVSRQRFGPTFSLGRMSWIKPNFLWMMFRCGWATKVDQERVLAITIQRSFFDLCLARAVASSHAAVGARTREEWQLAVRSSEVRLQWDPDHNPSGNPVERRALQLGLRGAALREFATTAIVAVEDMTEFVHQQHLNAVAPYRQLKTPRERVYCPREPLAARNVGLDSVT